jgi:mannosyltransferase OCH1-like enzyme
MEQLTIRSFQAHQHPFHLYAYELIEGVPEGTVVLDANQILPQSSIFQYKDHATYAGFANFFRYKVLLERGGWWVDMDTVCLAPFNFRTEYVFSSEVDQGKIQVNCAAIKAPAGSALFQHVWDYCKRRDPNEIQWGETGPHLMDRAVRELGLSEFVQPPKVFSPIDHPDWESILKRSANHEFGSETRAVHLWNEMWRRAGRDKNATYVKKSLYEKLKRQYGLASESESFWATALRKLKVLGS